MTSEELILEEYKTYTQVKENFVDRMFMTNKFYLVLILLLFLVTLFTQGFSFCWEISATVVFSAIGMVISILWWSNMDSYSLLIKVKLAGVIEEIEKQLPVKPSSMEYTAIKDYRKNKKMFVFSDAQKALATICFLFFFIFFINSFMPLISK